MNPNAGGEKPQSHAETPSVSPEQSESGGESQERVAPAAEAHPSASSAPVIVVPVSAPVIIPDDAVADDIAHPASVSSRNKVGDHIEKIWVDRAKAIIAQTRDDPFIQKKEVSKVKAEYIKKHFNKDIKMDDAVA